MIPSGSRVACDVARCAFLVVALLMGCSHAAAAHNRSISYSHWDVRHAGAEGSRARVTVRLSLLDLSRLPWTATEGLNPTLAAYLTTRLQLVADDTPCAVTGGPRAIAAAVGRAAYEWDVACPPATRLWIRSGLLLDVAPSHLHFARARLDGGESLERVLSEGERTWTLIDTSSAGGAHAQGTTFLGYVGLGVEHIVTGYDHLAFLLALLLVQTSLLEVAKIVTGFTVAHSITLALATIGYVRPEPGAIEALIGVSIALVAIENVWLVTGLNRLLPWLVAGALACLAGVASSGYGRVPGLTLAGLGLFSLCYFGLLERVERPAPMRWTIAFVFGLVHGFGFAAVLLEAHLPGARLAQALFGFNIGVEAGQLAAVLLIWPLLRVAAAPGRERLRFTVVDIGSAAICGLGVFWFVSRAYG